ncbi:Uncharacterised protein [Serratia marcescens]|nr:Uncharacterised protein [Serratia marcescens]CAI2784214.1 Uncharacterised protein [Serratia marcescens]
MWFIFFENYQSFTRLQHGFSTLSHIKTCFMDNTITFIRQAITKLLHDFEAMFGHSIKTDTETIGQRCIFH